MIKALLEGSYQRIQLHHVRLAFSDTMESVGKASWKKVWVLLITILHIWIARFRTGARVLYYPPSGPNKVPVVRDIALLCAVRWLFPKVIFHFHAGGVSTFRGELPSWMRGFFDRAYRRPTLAIRTAPQNPDDGAALHTVRSCVVPNGLSDMRGTIPERTAPPGAPLTVLFTGVLIPSKGVRVLVDAFFMAVDQGCDLRLEVMGKWGDRSFQQEMEQLVAASRHAARIQFLGEKRDEEKFARFAACDIFCFPSYFEAESFGLVLVEAMMFGKPVIATRWRGIPSVVVDEGNGCLVAVKDAAAVAEKLARLARDPALRRAMGAEGRRIFEARFTLERFQRAMETEMHQAITGANA